jgi:tetratricopeptide (TPR) repeat protein
MSPLAIQDVFMNRILIILTYVFACVAAITAAILGISFSETHREQYQVLKVIHEEPTQLVALTIVFLAMAYGAHLWKQLLTSNPHLEPIHVYGGQLSHKATRQTLKRELAGAEADGAKEAGLYFDDAEKEFAGRRYREAADGYQESLEMATTLSGCLNLGVSLAYLSEFRKAENCFMAGIEMARQSNDKEFEAAFLNNLANTYYREGKYERALESYRSALKSYEDSHDTQGQAAVYHNSGIVYHAQGKLEDALKSSAPAT